LIGPTRDADESRDPQRPSGASWFSNYFAVDSATSSDSPVVAGGHGRRRGSWQRCAALV